MTPDKPSSSRLPLLVVGVVVVVVALAIFGFERLFGAARSSDPLAPALPVEVKRAPEKEEAVVVGVEGTVERKGASGAWEAVRVGQRLVADDSLRTGTGARADIQIASKAKVTITESTELTVRELTSAVHRFQLTSGRITAAYDEAGERVVRIEGPKGTAVAEAKGARFNVLSTKQALAVATQTGVVNLAAAGKAVAIHQGQQAVAQAGQAPSAASPLPADILLKIAKARASGAGRCLVIDGEASPGSEVSVDGIEVALETNGKFHYDAPRTKGQKVALVLTRDVSGRVRQQSLKCKEVAAVEPEPEINVKMQWKTGG